MELLALSVGNEIEYRFGHGRRSKDFKGTVIGQTDSLYLVNLGRYRDTILKNNLISGEVVITAVYTKGEDTMPSPHKMEIPAVEYLRDLFEKSSNNISRAARNCDPPVSDVTMGRWLREAGIIPEGGLRKQPDAPPAEELRTDWDASNRKLSVLAKRHNVTGAIAKRWLKAAGIVTEGPMGIETIEPQKADPNDSNEGQLLKDQIEDSTDKQEDQTRTDNHGENKELTEQTKDTDGKDLLEAWRLISELAISLREVTEHLSRLENQVDAMITDVDELDHATIKKLVDFCIAPTQGRIDKLECSVASLAKLGLSKNNPEDCSKSEARLNVLADLFAAVLERI